MTSAIPHALRSDTLPRPERVAAAALSRALAGVAPAQRDAARQEGLDLVATIAGLKPLCLAGRGVADVDWHAALRRVAAEAGLCLLEAAPWFPADPSGTLPDWYVAATARRGAATVAYLCRDDAVRRRAAALSAEGRVAAADEAALLGYPVCCVAQHHRRALAFERLRIELLERIAQGDRERMARLVAAGIEPLPTSEADWRRQARLTAIAPAPATSVNMCDACATDPESAAARLSRRYRALAAAAAYPGT